MPLTACQTCGTPTRTGRYCTNHQPPKRGHWSKNRNRAAQDKFRQALIRRVGGKHCERCGTQNTEVQAHHLIPGNNDPTTGLLLCRPCHKELDPHAR